MVVGTKTKIVTMMVLTTTIMLIEVVVGYMTSCMSLIADSFHMLSDLVALIISFVCLYFANKSTKDKRTKATFGWVRAEILGALINAVFLITLCFTITIEAIKRLIHPEPISHPKVVLILGFIGLASDLLGMFLFHDSDHGHGHGGHVKEKNKEPVGWYLEKEFNHKNRNKRNGMPIVAERTLAMSSKDVEQRGLSFYSDEEQYDDHDLGDIDLRPIIRHPKGGDEQQEKKSSGSKLAARGVFLHIMGDAVGSIIVIVSATILLVTNWSFTIYLDPILSLLSVLVIIYSTYPLVKHSALILLQTVPENIDVLDLQNEFVTSIKGVLSVHDFHVWKLSEDQTIVTAHVQADPCYNYVNLSREINDFFHKKGIEHITIQVEYEITNFNEHSLKHQHKSRLIDMDCHSNHHDYDEDILGSPSSPTRPKICRSNRYLCEDDDERFNIISNDDYDDTSTHSLELRTDPITGRIYSVPLHHSYSERELDRDHDFSDVQFSSSSSDRSKYE